MESDASVERVTSLRERKQQAARDHVADAAAPLFVEQGYRATSTRQVARAAGVAEGTVFNLFGSKAELLLAALRRSVPDLRTGEAWASRARGLSDPSEVVELFVDTGAQVAELALPLVRVFLEAAAVDAVVAAAWREQEAFRLEGQRWLIDVLAEKGWLRSDRDVDDLARDLWVLAAPEVHIKWTDAGLGGEGFDRWRAGALSVLLIDPDHR
jgi:AcrR family transcriptional regulator